MLNKKSILTLFFFFASLVIIVSAFNGFITPIKYVPIVLLPFTLSFFIDLKYIDPFAIFSYFIYLVLCFVFTITNEADWFGLIVWLGYAFCFITYVFTSSDVSYDAFILGLEKYKFLALTFVIINIPLIFDASHYTAGNGQFGGVILNPNAFSATCGMFLIITLCLYSNRELSKSFSLCIPFLCFFLLLSLSRSSILSIIFTMLFLKVSMNKKVIFVIIASLIFAGYWGMKTYLSDELMITVSQRDIYADTGRIQIFKDLLQTLTDNYFFFGTGLSEFGGRVKRELAYIDIYTFSGVGFIFFLMFVSRIYYFIYSIRNVTLSGSEQIPQLIFIYVTFLSIFEAYVSNIANILSVLFYISSALITIQYYKYARRLGC